MGEQKIIVVIDLEGAKELGYQDAQDTLIFAISDFIHRINEGEGGSLSPIPIRSFATIQGPLTQFKLGGMSEAQQSALAAGRAKRDANRAAKHDAVVVDE